MGKIAEMMLDGTLCEGCGVYLDGEGDGVPRRCGACRREARQPQPNAQGKVVCKSCHCLVKATGLADHMRDKHGAKNKRPPTRAARLLTALRELHDVCTAMDLANENERPTEDRYQAAMAAAKKAIDEADASPYP